MNNGLNAKEFNSIYMKLNAFLFLENLGSIVEIEKRPAENGLFLRIKPREERKETWTDDCIPYDEQIDDESEDGTNQPFLTNPQGEMADISKDLNDFNQSNSNDQAKRALSEDKIGNQLGVKPGPNKSDTDSFSVKTKHYSEGQCSLAFDKSSEPQKQKYKKTVHGSEPCPEKPKTEGDDLGFSCKSNAVDLPYVSEGENKGTAEAPNGVQNASGDDAGKPLDNAFTDDVRKKYFCCKRCPMAFDKNCQLVKHRETVHREEINPPCKSLCTKCNVSFPNRGAIMKHWWKEHRIHKCRDCSEIFPDGNSLKKHKHLVHNKDPYYEAPVYNCTLCEFKSTNKGTMQNHRKRNHTGKRFPCLECDKAFAVLAELRRHVNNVHVQSVHGNNRKQECNLCLKKLPCQRQLTRHQKTPHLYSCNRCTLVFNTVHARKQHSIDAHNEEVPLKALFPKSCVKCQIPFSSLDEYASHKKTHENEQVERSSDYSICLI